MKILYSLKPAPIILLLLFLLTDTNTAQAQCGPSTPSFTVDLRGNPDSIWYSSSVARADTCCSGSNCVEFIVYVDSTVLAIQLDIVAGAMPSGSLFYQVDCGPQTSIGTPLCLSGNGPYKITFCKPGNNKNGYRLTPISRPIMPQTITVGEGCTGLLKTYGFVDSTIRWSSLSGSAYNSYLSCTSGCDSTYVTPQAGFPTYVDYLVCGRPDCKQITLCDTIRVYFAKKLVTTIEPNNLTLCWSDSFATIEAKITGGKPPYSYLWNTGQTTSKINAKPGTYWVQVIDASVCTPSVDSVVVSKVSGAPMADAGRDTAICAAASASLNGKVYNVPGGIWTGNGTFNPSATDMNATYAPIAAEILAGKAVVKLYTQGIYGCPEVNDEVIITIVKKPAPVIGGALQLCGGSWNVPYAAQSISGNIYIWTVSGGKILSGQGTAKINIHWGFGDSGNVVLTEINPTGCSTTVQQKVILLKKPQPEISGPEVVCEYSAIATFSTPTVSGSNYNWLVTGGNIIFGQGTPTIKVRWGATGSGSVSVKETSGICDSTVTKSILVMPRPQPVITGADNVCQYGNAENYFVTYDAFSLYKWQVNGGTIVGEDNASFVIVKWGGAGKGKVIVTQTNVYGCDTNVSMNINIHGRPLIGIIGDSGVCEKSTKDYHARDTSQTLNEWLIDNGLPITGLDGNAIKVNWAKSGVGNIILKQTSKEGCDTTAMKNVDVNNKPVPYMNGKDTVCANSIEKYEIGATPGHKYKWIVLNGSILGSSTTPMISVKWNSASTGYIFLTETNTKGCDSTVMTKVTVAAYPEPIVSGPIKVCEEKGGYTYTTPYISKSIFTWLVSGGVVESQNQNTINVKWNTEGNGYILVRETNAYGCSITDTLNVEIIKLKTVATPQVVYPCDPSPVKFNLDANDVLLSVQWNFGDGTTSTERNPTHIYQSPGTYQVSVISHSVTGCSDSAGTTVTIYNGPDAEFDINYNYPEQVFYCLDDSVLFTNRSNAGLRYLWDFGDSTGNDYFHTGHIYKKPGHYDVKLIAFNELGCVDSITKTIYVDARVSLYQPNAFTPGSSKNINDYFSVAMYNIETLHIDIYNRWGERVFESDKIDFKWDGTYKGEPVQQDVYIYVIKAINVKGDPETRYGTIMLLR